MRNRKMMAVNQGELLDGESEERVVKTRKKNEIVVRQKTVNEIIAENSAALGASVDGVRLLSKLELHQAMLRVNLPSISKDNKIVLKGGGSYRVASFENMHKAVNDLLLAQGLRMFFVEVDQPDKTIVKVNCILTNGVHEEISPVTMPVVPGPGQTPQQAKASAMTYACRHGMMRLLNLNSHAPEDRDVEPVKQDDTPIGSQQCEIALKAVQDNKVPWALIEQHYGVNAETLSQLPAQRFKKFLDSCALYGTRNK